MTLSVARIINFDVPVPEWMALAGWPAGVLAVADVRERVRVEVMLLTCCVATVSCTVTTQHRTSCVGIISIQARHAVATRAATIRTCNVHIFSTHHNYVGVVALAVATILRPRGRHVSSEVNHAIRIGRECGKMCVKIMHARIGAQPNGRRGCNVAAGVTFQWFRYNNNNNKNNNNLIDIAERIACVTKTIIAD